MKIHFITLEWHIKHNFGGDSGVTMVKKVRRNISSMYCRVFRIKWCSKNVRRRFRRLAKQTEMAPGPPQLCIQLWPTESKLWRNLFLLSTLKYLWNYPSIRWTHKITILITSGWCSFIYFEPSLAYNIYII